MCDGNIDENKNCIVDGGIIELTKDSTYKHDDIVSLVFKDTKITCLNDKKQYCDITFDLANKWKNTAGGCC